MFICWILSIILIGSGLSVISYCIQVWQEHLCGHSNLYAEATDYVLNNPPKPETQNLRQLSTDEQISLALANLTETCPEMQRKIYYQWHFLSGGVSFLFCFYLYVLKYI